MTAKKIVYIVNPRSGIGTKDGLESEVETYTDKENYDYDIYYTQ